MPGALPLAMLGVVHLLPFLSLIAILGACQAPHARPSLRYAPSDPIGWTSDAQGVLRNVCGPARLEVNLDPLVVRLEVAADNPSGQSMEVRVGAQGAAIQGAIGELRRRALDGSRAEDVPAVEPYLAHQPAEVRPGWRGTFELDTLLGRGLTLGQYVVLQIEVREPGRATPHRCLLPLVATNVARTRSR